MRAPALAQEPARGALSTKRACRGDHAASSTGGAQAD